MRILHITDPHLHAAPEARMRGVNTLESFHKTIAAAGREQPRPDLMLATGDLCQDESEAGYRHFRDALQPWNVPVLSIPGNHDSPEKLRAILNTDPFQVGGVHDHDNWRVIALDSWIPGDNGGRLGAEGLATLQSGLERSDGRFVLIAVHHHPIPTGSRWLDGVGLYDADAFLALVDRYADVRLIVWGHVHQASDRMRGHCRLLSTPSTCSQFLPSSERFALDSRPPAYRWIELASDGTIRTEVIWVENA